MEHPHEYLVQTSEESIHTHLNFIKENADLVVKAAEWIAQSVKKGGKVLIMGNGGSAADAQHMAAEMVGRMLVNRRPLAAIALTTDTSGLTAVGNDFGFEHVFVKQIQALARPDDIVIAISTSGNSLNIISAVKEAQKIGCRVIGLAGGSGGQLKSMSDLALIATAGKNSCRIQETHIFAIHSMVDILDRFYLE